MNTIQNYAIQFLFTAGVVYLLGTTDTAAIVQMASVSVLSSVVADLAMPYISAQASNMSS